jgi:hypothetical protein
MTYYAPPRGGGTITVDKPTKESETTRQLWYFVWLLSIRALAALLLFVEIALVGPWAGPLLVLGSLWYAADSAGLWLEKGGLPRIEYRMHPGMWRNVTWLLGSLLGYVLTLAAVTGHWLPIEWEAQDRVLWLVTPWTIQPVLPNLYTVAIWLRWAAILAMPWITWRPFSVLHWVFEAESTFKNLREVSFRPADPGAINTPLGRVYAREDRQNEPAPMPESSAPAPAMPTGKVKLAGPAPGSAPPVDLV